MRHDRQRSPAEIEGEIARVRRSMDATLHEIESRLTTGQLVDQGIDYLRNSGAREFVSNLGASVKHNPLSVTLVGIGLAWLMFSGRRSAPGAGMGYADVTGASESSSLTERAADALDRVSDTAAATRDSASRSMRAATETWAQTASSVRDRARRAAATGRRQAERARQGFDYMLHEQPLALGAIGLAVGAAVAAAVPRTRREDEWMGAASDRVTEQAKELGKEQLEKARQMASESGTVRTEESPQPAPAPGP
ncbi:MAG: DUF3618 domain-containing protein [Betaproteobacteria bacterium]